MEGIEILVILFVSVAVVEIVVLARRTSGVPSALAAGILVAAVVGLAGLALLRSQISPLMCHSTGSLDGAVPATYGLCPSGFGEP